MTDRTPSQNGFRFDYRQRPWVVNPGPVPTEVPIDLWGASDWTIVVRVPGAAPGEDYDGPIVRGSLACSPLGGEFSDPDELTEYGWPIKIGAAAQVIGERRPLAAVKLFLSHDGPDPIPVSIEGGGL